MDIFAWLLLGHCLGDWVFQNDWMARGKKRGLFTLAGLVHFTIYTAVVMGLLWLSGAVATDPTSFICLGSAIFASHWLIDATTLVESWMHFYRQSDTDMVRVMVDQTLHLLVLALLTWFVGR